MEPGIPRIPQRVLQEGDSQVQRFPKATGTQGLQKTPEEAKQQHLSASSSFQKHIEKRIILGQSFKNSQVALPESAGKGGKKEEKKGLGGMGNYFKPSPNLVQDAKMPRTIRAGAYFYSASP